MTTKVATTSGEPNRVARGSPSASRASAAAA